MRVLHFLEWPDTIIEALGVQERESPVSGILGSRSLTENNGLFEWISLL
jgi:hypothetical protein